jgi:hypothetical protein
VLETPCSVRCGVTHSTSGATSSAYERVRRVEVTVRDGKITRYELRFTG